MNIYTVHTLIQPFYTAGDTLHMNMRQKQSNWGHRVSEGETCVFLHCPCFLSPIPRFDHVIGPQVCTVQPAWKQAWLTALAALPFPYLREAFVPALPRCSLHPKVGFTPAYWLPSMLRSSCLPSGRAGCIERPSPGCFGNRSSRVGLKVLP